MCMMQSQSNFKKKRKIERHRFAGPPENARIMHNQMLKSSEEDYNIR